MIQLIVWLCATICSAIFYRCGGATGYNTKFRDMGLPTVGIIALLLTYHHYNWQLLLAYLLCFGLYFGSLTTYWKKKGTDAHWYNWVFTGLGYSLAFLPFAFVTGHWLGFVLRTILVSVLTALWSEKIGNAVWEEMGRGVITTITLPLLLI